MGTRTARACGGALIAAALGLLGCTAAGDDEGGGGGACTAGQIQPCGCSDGTTATQTCRSDGLGFLACQCAIAGGQAAPATTFAQMPMGGAMSVPPPPPAAGMSGGTAPPPPPAAGTAGTMPIAGAGGVAGSLPMAGASGTSGAGTGGTGGMMGTAGMLSTGTDDLEEVRQLCVDYINMYRATLSLTPLARGTMAQETCSDEGAKSDADSGMAHGSAGDCQGLGGQDTCPGWGVGGFSGNATLGDALTNCLDAMWAEGPPPVPDDQCIADYQNCFLKHGHYMNMSGDYGVVACGFYEMSDGKWWMNQNFGR